jgi:hypothetical protein
MGRSSSLYRAGNLNLQDKKLKNSWGIS